MATIQNVSAAGAGNQVVGKVVIIYGTVKAISADGTVRLLAPNSPIFANDQIITESDGRVSIAFDGTPPSQMDLGRMSNVVIDEDVYAGPTSTPASDVTADIEQIQKALFAADDTLIELEAPAAGGSNATGGGHPIFLLDPTGAEVTPTSGAETIGVTYGALTIPEGVVTEPGAPIATNTITLTDGVSVNEGGEITYTATLTHAAQGDIDVTLSNGSHITIPSGAISGTVTVPAPGDDVYIDTSTVTTTIAGATGGGTDTLVIDTTPAVTIIPDTPDSTIVSLSGPSSVNEGETATYTVTVEHVPQTNMTVDVTYTYLSASSNDIVTTTTQVTILAGQSTAHFSVDTVADQIVEGTENYSVSISNPQGGNFENPVIGAGSVTTNIVDASSLHFNITGDTSVTEGSTAAYVVSYTGTLANGQTASVHVETGAGTTLVTDATSGVDYDAVTQTLTFTGGGATSANVSVVTLTDAAVEGTEEYSVNLSAPSANAIIDTGSVTTNIVDGNVAPTNTTASVAESAMDTVKDVNDLAASNDIGTNPSSLNETVSGSLNLQQGWTAVASSGSTSYGTYEIHSDGTFVYTLVDAPNNPAPPAVGESALTDTISYSITNGIVTQTNNSLTVTIADDAPVFTQIDYGIISNQAGVLTGTHDMVFGADGEQSINLSALTPLPGVNYSTAIHNLDGSTTITAGTSLSTTGFFELTVRPDNTYDFNLLDPRPSTFDTVTFPEVTGGAGVPSLTIGSGADSITFTGIAGDTIKPTGVGFGVNDGNLNGPGSHNLDGDIFNISFAGNAVDSVTFGVKQQGNSPLTMDWTTDSGDTGSVSYSANGTFTVDPTLDFHWINFTVTGDSNAKIDSFGYSQNVFPDNQVLQFNVSATDSDFDTTSPQILSIKLLGGTTGADIMGTSGDDAILGTSSGETINGLGGNDTLTGGDGADTFKVGEGHDTVKDFTDGTDKLVIEPAHTDVLFEHTAGSTTVQLTINSSGGPVGSVALEGMNDTSASNLLSTLIADGENVHS
jgi:hypothetical protein